MHPIGIPAEVPTIDPELEAAVLEWTERVPDVAKARPAVALEPRAEGTRVKITYLGVESGVLFAAGTPVMRPAVQGTLDRLFDVLSWRVVAPRA